MRARQKKAPPTPEQRLKQQQTAHKRNIRNTFTGAGFKYIPTNNRQIHIGFRDVEIDSLFIYENIWLICEDTVKTSNVTEHIQTKNEAMGIINANMPSFVQKLCELFPEQQPLFTKYQPDRIKPFGLYIPFNDPNLSAEDYQRFSNLVFVLPQTTKLYGGNKSGFRNI